ncbi:MAG: hypothetical protein LBI61_01195 [Puniceicoccales bacterium]|nr:hypothetical protein [Puniceicoccales bacterium]
MACACEWGIGYLDQHYDTLHWDFSAIDTIGEGCPNVVSGGDTNARPPLPGLVHLIISRSCMKRMRNDW